MQQTALDDHIREKDALLERMLSEPGQDWTREGRRVVSLHQTIVAEQERRHREEADAWDRPR